MSYHMLPPTEGGGTTTNPVPIRATYTVTEYKFDEVRNNYSGVEPTSFIGEVDVYNPYGTKIGFNPYGYVSEIVTNDFEDKSGVMVAGSGPHTIEFYSIFKITDKSKDDEEFYKLSLVTGQQVWQTIRYSSVGIYLEDESGNKVDLDPYDEGIGITTLCNATKAEIYELPAYMPALIGKLFDYLVEGFKVVMGKTVGAVIEVVSVLACFFTPQFKEKEFSLTNSYDTTRNKALVDFSWGNPDQEFIESMRHRQELVFKIYLNFYAPPNPGNYTLVFNQVVYVNPSSQCSAPPDDTEYRWYYHLKLDTESKLEMPCWVRIFETRYPVTLVERSAIQYPGEPGEIIKPTPVETGRFVVNTSSKEIHDTRNVTPACNVGSIREEHKKYLDTIEDVKRVITEQGYDGCHYCMPDYDTG